MRPTRRREVVANHPDASDGADGEVDPLLVCILQTSFLKKQSAKDKKDARLVGQMNETKLLHKLWAKASDCPLALDSILQPGLVSQRDRPFLKSSADGIIEYTTDNGSTENGTDYMPVKLKTLVSIEKQQKMAELLLHNVGANTYREAETYFREVPAARASK
jgi:hypothetical protein